MLVSARAVLAVVASGLLLAACTNEVGGNPGGGNSGTTAPVTSGSVTSSAVKVPPPVRPAVIKLAALDPCKALTVDQMNQLGVAKNKRSDNDLVKKGDVPVCLYTPNPAKFTYQVGFVPNEGIGYWREGSGNVDRKETQVAGFDAIRTNLIGQSESCSFWVDVADGQMVYVNFLPIDDLTLDQVCEKAQKGTELALATLKTLG
jgi:hypothetical protein